MAISWKHCLYCSLAILMAASAGLAEFNSPAHASRRHIRTQQVIRKRATPKQVQRKLFTKSPKKVNLIFLYGHNGKYQIRHYNMKTDQKITMDQLKPALNNKQNYQKLQAMAKQLQKEHVNSKAPQVITSNQNISQVKNNQKNANQNVNQKNHTMSIKLSPKLHKTMKKFNLRYLSKYTRIPLKVLRKYNHINPNRTLKAGSKITLPTNNGSFNNLVKNVISRGSGQAWENYFNSFDHLTPREIREKNTIVFYESNGRYNAKSYGSSAFGKYQLLPRYLHGDFSPANQEKTADYYVTHLSKHFHNWNGAYRFRRIHHWY